MTDVFISYSRADSAFVRELNNALKRRGRETWVDWEDIPRGEQWLNEIHRGIENAETFLCIVSRHSLTSEICNEEIAYALSRNKRVMPLILEAIEGETFNEIAGKWMTVEWEKQARQNWDALRHLNWIFFSNAEQFEPELNALIEAMDTDLGHVRAHTRYLTRALEWNRENRKPSLLLIGDEIDEAEAWLKSARAASKLPAPSALHVAYITSSRAEETKRAALAAAQQRRTRNLLRASMILGIMVVVAVIATMIAASSASLATQESERAGTNVAIASTEKAESDAFRQQVEFDATLFALDQANAQVMLRRFGIVPTDAETLAPEQIIARATAAADPTANPTVEQRVAGTDMVQVPAGCFLMGSVIDSAAPVTKMCFDAPYWIDRLEVTRGQYEVCVAAGVCAEAVENVYSTLSDQPVNNVLWTDALDYCAWRGARLPTEPEWEYAARGPASLIYPWGDTFNPDYLVYIGNSNFSTAPVGERPPESASWVGALDMSGNVWEWVSTAYALDDFSSRFDYPYDASDGREDLTRTDVIRVTRGGSFNDDQNNPRGAHRGWLHPTERDEGHQLIGFRCAASELVEGEGAG